MRLPQPTNHVTHPKPRCRYRCEGMQNPLQVHQQIPQHVSVLRNSPAPTIQHASAPDCCRQRPCRRASQSILGQRQTVPRRCSALSHFALNCCCFGSYVGGFSASCDVEMLTKVFSRFGNVPLPSQASHRSRRIPCTSRVTRLATARFCCFKTLLFLSRSPSLPQVLDVSVLKRRRSSDNLCCAFIRFD